MGYTLWQANPNVPTGWLRVNIPTAADYKDLVKQGWKTYDPSAVKIKTETEDIKKIIPNQETKKESTNIISNTMDNLNIKSNLIDLDDLENSSSLYAVGLFIVLGLLIKTIGGIFE